MLEYLTNEKMEELKSDGYTLIFYYYDSICYENSSGELKFPIRTNGKKTNTFYYVLTRGGNLLKTKNLKNFTKNIKYRYITCGLDYDDEIDLDNDSYHFHTDIPSLFYKRMRTTFYDIPTEVLVLKESDIANYLKEEDY
ncbi:hypothetical protein PG623_10200 [Riemerella anatipestifer]|nr:hypothetical protein [Riemerella anatipestifer]